IEINSLANAAIPFSAWTTSHFFEDSSKFPIPPRRDRSAVLTRNAITASSLRKSVDGRPASGRKHGATRNSGRDELTIRSRQELLSPFHVSTTRACSIPLELMRN